jgi:hypothetical protein
MFKNPLQAKWKEMEARNPSTTQYETSLGEILQFVKRWLLGSVESADEAYARNPTGEREFQRFMNSSNRSYKADNYDYKALEKAVELFAKNRNEGGLRQVVNFIQTEIPDLETHGAYWLVGQGNIVGLHFGQAREQLIETLSSALERAGCSDNIPVVKQMKSGYDDRAKRRENLKNVAYPECVVRDVRAFI